MPTVTLTITDTPTGQLSIHSTFVPAVGRPCSPAQQAALEIINRTNAEWGVKPPALAKTRPALNITTLHPI